MGVIDFNGASRLVGFDAIGVCDDVLLTLRDEDVGPPFDKDFVSGDFCILVYVGTALAS